MPSFNKVSLYIPSGEEVERAARVAMERIDRQLKNMLPVKKAASAADNFPGIYNNPADFKPHVLGQREPNKEIFKKLASDMAIHVYKNAG